MKRNLYVISKEDKDRIHHACFQIKSDKQVKVKLDEGELFLIKDKSKVECYFETKRRGEAAVRKKVYETKELDSLEQSLTDVLSKKEERRIGDSKTRAKKKYRDKTYDSCQIYYPKGEIKKLDKEIKRLGYESRSEFFREAAEEKIKRESKKK